MGRAVTEREEDPRARRASRPIWVGGVRLGGGAPVAVEAALPRAAGRDRAALRALRAAAEDLERAGADLLRLDCATPEDVETLRLIAPGCALPVLADIGGGDAALAGAAIEAGARGIWFTPIDQDDAALAELVQVARAHGCMLGLRLGMAATATGPAAPSPPIALAGLALRETGRLARSGCEDMVIALRLDDPLATLAAMRAIGRACDLPLALAPGATTVAAALAIGLPLGQGLGDLIRLPASRDPGGDMRAAVQAIRALGLRPRGIECEAEPGFLRLRPDAAAVLSALEDRLATLAGTSVAVALSAAPSVDPTGPSVAAQESEGDGVDALRLRVACGSCGAMPASDLVERVARLVEDRAGARRARDLHRLASDLGGGEDPVARPWIEAAVALFALGRGRSAPIVWGSPIGAAAWLRLAGRRPSWQMPHGPAAAADAVDDPLAGGTISTALGLALAARRAGQPADVVAVVEPASVASGAGLAAIRAARVVGVPLLVVMLDPDLDEGGLPGAVAAQISRLVSSAPYLAMRDLGKQIVRNLPGPGYALARRAEEFARGLAAGGFMFDELGVYYVGPVPGRRYDQLLPVLRNLRDARRDQPVLLHVAASPGSGRRADGGARGERLAAFLGRSLAADTACVAIVQSVAIGSDAVAALEGRFRGRVLRAQGVVHHGLGLARGLAAGGMRPLLVLDRRSLWPEAGQALRGWLRLGLPATLLVDLAEGASDLPWLDAPPLDLAVLAGMAVLHAADVADLDDLLTVARERPEQPAVIAFDARLAAASRARTVCVGDGMARRLRSGGDVAILAVGRGVAAAAAAAEQLAERGVAASVVDAVMAQPFDAALVRDLAAAHSLVVVVDDPPMAGRIGAAARAALDAEASARLRVVTMGRRAVAEILAAATPTRA
jgi:1-deoxy-D-xylulose-5-phosphate synthase